MSHIHYISYYCCIDTIQFLISIGANKDAKTPYDEDRNDEIRDIHKSLYVLSPCQE